MKADNIFSQSGSIIVSDARQGQLCGFLGRKLNPNWQMRHSAVNSYYEMRLYGSSIFNSCRDLLHFVLFVD